ncbi:MAG TPA: sterol desaturase family protein [Methylomirabilota bacterium]|jgi:sterol desaturase/sphingolipid hydroxylase (fatty acid hydroxylase superfamily)
MALLPPLDLVGSPILLGVLVVCLAAEAARPLRARVQTRGERLPTNVAMMAIASVMVRGFVIPVSVLLATMVTTRSWGLVPLLDLPAPAAAGIAFIAADYATWLWHRLNHQIPFLWRFHAVHHTDLDLDVTTAFRFHAGELALSLGFRALAIVVLGLGPALLLVYEIAMDAATAFHHSNLRLPVALERPLSLLVVTPRMHAIHHSIVEREATANWSVVFSWWDRLHGTLRLDVAQDALVIGVPAYRAREALTLGKLLVMPFRRHGAWWRLPDGRYPDRRPRGTPTRLAV